MKAPRVVRDGKVAVLYSPGFGAGWSTWSSGDASAEMMFCPDLVAAVERKAPAHELSAIARRIFPGEYDGGVGQLKIEWLPEGALFRIHEYNGSERVEVREELDWEVA